MSCFLYEGAAKYCHSMEKWRKKIECGGKKFNSIMYFVDRRQIILMNVVDVIESAASKLSPYVKERSSCLTSLVLMVNSFYFSSCDFLTPILMAT